jgi:anti-anti-sigma factor
MAPVESSSVTVARRGLRALVGDDADRTVVWVRGEHDMATVTALSETLARAIALDEANVLVDLSEVQFMGAATVGVIVRAREFLRLRSRTLALRSPSRCARRVVDVCGLSDLIDAAVAPVGALGTWVNVPASQRIEPAADVPTPASPSTEDPIRVGSL